MIEVGQEWVGVKSGITFLIVKVTTKSVKVKYEMMIDGQLIEKKGNITKEHLIKHMKQKRE
jgi:hypothetical protein